MEVIRTPAAELASTAAVCIADCLRTALQDRGTASLAVSGGSTPAPMFERLARIEFDWPNVSVFQVDERVAPAGHADRNLTSLEQTLLAPTGATSRPMPVEDDDLDRAAAAYEASLPVAFDVVHLGLGTDGHTASLVPGDPVLEVTDRHVAVTDEYQGRRRMTLTYPSLDVATAIVWLVRGDSKRGPLAQLMAADHSIPGGRVNPTRATVITDIAP